MTAQGEYWRENLMVAVRGKKRADDLYLDAIIEALQAGVSYADIGRELGISRQAVRQYVQKGAK